MIKENIVSIQKSKSKDYPLPPFNPSKIFLEFQNFNLYKIKINKQNDIYSSVRKLLMDLELDKKNIGTKKWNPFKDLIKKGQKVVIKPNLVMDTHPLGKKGVLCTITHASVIRPIIDYLLLATKGKINITICDVPLQSANWNNLIKISRLKDLVDYYEQRKVKINLLDLRYEIAIKNKEGLIIKKIKKIRDPKGYSIVNLGKGSALMPIIKYYKKLEITDYGSGTVLKHHNYEKNEYFISNTILNSDLFINVPKLKTHQKAGITFAMKNLIGINGDKSWIAHHRSGSPKKGGDEYLKFRFKNLLKAIWVQLKKSKFRYLTKFSLKVYQKIILKGKTFAQSQISDLNIRGITDGSWYGNDTLWRCIKDLNNIIFYANKKGKMKKQQQRKYFSIGDGIIAGDKEGPMENIPKPGGILIGGFNPVYIDRVAASIMGFDYQKIPQIKNGFINQSWNLCRYTENEIIWKSNLKNVKELNLKFVPPRYWVGHIEK